MPLSQQHTSESEKRCSLEILSMESYIPPAVASKSNLRIGPTDLDPALGMTPHAMLPPNCFSPKNCNGYGSYSEKAQNGGGWNEEPLYNGHPINGLGLNDLVSSIKALSMTTETASKSRLNNTVARASLHLHVSYDETEKNVENGGIWGSDAINHELYDGHDANHTVKTGAIFYDANGVKLPYPRWQGELPARILSSSGSLSSKVFMGGLPWDISEQDLMKQLSQFSPVRVEWPGRDYGSGGPRGFAYVTLESEHRVRALLNTCRVRRGDYLYRLDLSKPRNKEVQVIPWAVGESTWVGGGACRLAAARTVFVGALHGQLAAPDLARIMQELFGNVVYAGIDLDKSKYPIGSGRVTFGSVRSYLRAIAAGFVDVITDKFTKKVQIDPYLEDSMCSVCNIQQGPYFCREPVCFKYYCRSCWIWQHKQDNHHRVLTRTSKTPQFSLHNDLPQSPNSLAHSSSLYSPDSPTGSPSSLSGLPLNGPRQSSPSDQDSFTSGYFGGTDCTSSPPASGSSGTFEHSALPDELDRAETALTWIR